MYPMGGPPGPVPRASHVWPGEASGALRRLRGPGDRSAGGCFGYTGDVARVLIAALLALGPAIARAQSCAEPSSPKEARPLAREWFARGQKAQEAGDETEAVRAYACSMRIYAHAFTAYNLAKAAEKSGDLQLAIDNYRRYLELASNPKDKDDVEQTISLLEERLAKVKSELNRPAPVVSPAPPPQPPPLVSRRSPPLPPAAPPASGPRYRPAAWTALALGTVAGGAAIALNVSARARVDDCHTRFQRGDPKYADSCGAAKPLAYSSYALFAVGGVALATSVALFVAGRAPSGPEVAVAPAEGGVAVLVASRF